MGRDFARHNDVIALNQRFASNPSKAVLCKTGIEDAVRNTVSYLIRVPLSDGFGRKDVR
jgi:hypothetical protein